MMSLEQQYAAGKQACAPDEVNFKPDVGIDQLAEYFMVGKARNLVLYEFNTLFMVEFLVSGYDTLGNDNEYRSSLTLKGKTKDEALDELRHHGLYEYYSARFKEDGYLAW